MSTAVSLNEVPFWIDGKPATAESTRRGEVTNAATGRSCGSFRSPTPRMSIAAVQAAAARLPEWRADAAVAPRADSDALPRAARARPEELARSSARSTARCFSTRWARCSAASKWSSSRAARRTCSRASIRRSVGRGVDAYSLPAAARRVRRHHAVQLSGDGAAVDVSGRPRLRQHLRPEAVGEGSVGQRAAWRSCCKEAGLPDGVFNVVHGDKEAVDAILAHPDSQGGVVRRLDAGRQVHLRDGGRGTGSACRRSAARRITPWCCPTRISSSRPTR